MLGTLLDKLQSLFSKNFVISSIPLFAFLLFNGLMSYRVSYYFQQWIEKYFLSQDPTRQALLAFGTLLLVVIVSYVLSTLSVFMREVLEGKHFLGKFVSNALCQRFRNRLAQVEKKLDEARKKRRVIRQKQEIWTRALSDAYQLGKTANQCIYERQPELTTLIDARTGNQEIALPLLEAEVNTLATTLQTNNPEMPNNVQSERLDQDHGEVLSLIRFSLDKAQAEYARHLTEFQFDYAGEEVAPTKMGNISRVAPHYAASRYSLNLDIFWTRLQKVIQNDANFYSVLQDAKMQLDFLVGLVWYTLLFTLIWVAVLPGLGEAKNLFQIIAIAGPLLTYVWYRIALQNYRAFSDLLRACVDLYRLDLLKALHVPLPANAEQERLIWETMEQRLVYGEHSNIVLQAS